MNTEKASNLVADDLTSSATLSELVSRLGNNAKSMIQQLLKNGKLNPIFSSDDQRVIEQAIENAEVQKNSPKAGFFLRNKAAYSFGEFPDLKNHISKKP